MVVVVVELVGDIPMHAPVFGRGPRANEKPACTPMLRTMAPRVMSAGI